MQYTVRTIRLTGYSDPFQVIVTDEQNRRVVEMTAMSQAHAKMVAGSISLLLPRLGGQSKAAFDMAAASTAAGSAAHQLV